MNLVLMIIVTVLTLLGAIPGNPGVSPGSGVPSVSPAGGPVITPVTVATAAPVAGATPRPIGPLPTDIPGGGPSH